jgi:thioredoxin-like negative regulator of GroEL
MLAKLYALTKHDEDARRVLASVSPDARVEYALAELERSQGDSAYAARLREVLTQSPTNRAVRLQLADAELRVGAADSALRYLEDVRRVPPEPPREAKRYLDEAIEALRAGKLVEARPAFDRFMRLIEVSAPYQASLAQVDWVEGPLPGRPILAFDPASLITMRGIAPASTVEVRFTDVTGETGLPDLHAQVTALALADYDADGEDNLLVAAPNARMYTVHGGFVADISDKASTNCREAGTCGTPQKNPMMNSSGVDLRA